MNDILNDPSVMPNADCRDMVVSISRIEFGSTVRDIYVDVGYLWRAPQQHWRQRHDQYMDEARMRGEDTYIDFTDVFDYEANRRLIAVELQKRLKLLYTPSIRRIGEIAEG